jgi:hypothetical protein
MPQGPHGVSGSLSCHQYSASHQSPHISTSNGTLAAFHTRVATQMATRAAAAAAAVSWERLHLDQPDSPPRLRRSPLATHTVRDGRVHTGSPCSMVSSFTRRLCHVSPHTAATFRRPVCRGALCSPRKFVSSAAPENGVVSAVAIEPLKKHMVSWKPGRCRTGGRLICSDGVQHLL